MLHRLILLATLVLWQVTPAYRARQFIAGGSNLINQGRFTETEAKLRDGVQLGWEWRTGDVSQATGQIELARSSIPRNLPYQRNLDRMRRLLTGCTLRP